MISIPWICLLCNPHFLKTVASISNLTVASISNLDFPILLNTIDLDAMPLNAPMLLDPNNYIISLGIPPFLDTKERLISLSHFEETLVMSKKPNTSSYI